MSRVSAFTTFALRKLWTAVAVGLVLFALLMSVLRYSLPLLDGKKHVLEDYVAQEYGVSLKIGKVSSLWQYNGPSILLSNVTLARNDASPIQLEISELSVQIDFWESLLSGQLSSKDFFLDGLLVDIDLQQIQSSSSEFPIVDALESLFLEQLQHFSLTNSRISLSSKNLQQSYDVQNLSWLNRGQRHQGTGLIRVAELASNSASFVIDLYEDGDTLNGTLYAKADELDLSPWLNELIDFKMPLVEGRGNLELWADIQDRKLGKVHGKLLSSQFVWQNDEQDVVAKILQGDIIAQPQGSTWLFNVNDLSLQVQDQELSSNWIAKVDADGALELALDSDLPLQVLLPLEALFSHQGNVALSSMQASANLSELQIAWSPQHFAATAMLRKAQWQGNTKIPAVSAFDASLFWQNGRGTVSVQQDTLALGASALYENAMQVSDLNLQLNIDPSAGGYQLSAQNAAITLGDLHVNTDVMYDIGSQYLSLHSSIDTIPTALVTDYLPNNVVGGQTKAFLRRAFTNTGTVDGAQILFQGTLSDYPFAEQQGIFQASVDIQNSDFIFSSQWPRISGMNANLMFENRSLIIRAPSASMLDIKLNDISANIPYLGAGADLVIEAQASGSGYGVSQLMLQSSLASTLGATLDKSVLISNDVQAQLSLYVPLDAPDATSVSGVVSLANNYVQIPAINADLHGLNGKLYFTDDKVNLTDVQAKLLGQAISIDFNGGKALANGESAYRFDVNLDGDWQVATLIPFVGEKFSDYLTGEAAWSSSVNVTLVGERFSYTADLFSQLKGIESLLPQPFNKQSAQQKTLTLQANGDERVTNIAMSLGDKVKFDGILPHKERQFSRAHLALGETDFVGLGVGFSISADLASIDIVPWYQTVNALVSNVTQSKNPIFPVPQRIFVESEEVLISNQKLSDVNLTAKREGSDWLLDLVADEAKATVVMHDKWLEKGIEINADFVSFNQWIEQSEQATPEIAPQSLPPIRLNCERCEVLDHMLGKVKFESYPNDDGMRIEALSIDGPHGSVSTNGQWYKRNGDHYTFMSGDLKSNDFGAFLKDFTFDSGIKDSEAAMDFTFTWKASPFDFAFKDLDGEVDWRLSDGYLTELSDKGSRIFTLLSLDSLLRKLSLDFRDVFAKGFFYDNMSGSIQLTEGKADTRDTKIDGGAGEMQIYGYTDLVNQELNYNVSFTPNVTGNLPVLVYFMVNPPTAIAALALDQVLSSTKVISNVNYSITGTLSEPVLIETGRQSTEVDLPARRIKGSDGSDEDFVLPNLDEGLRIEMNEG